MPRTLFCAVAAVCLLAPIAGPPPEEAVYRAARSAIGPPDALAQLTSVAVTGERRFRNILTGGMETSRLELYFAFPDRFRRMLRPDALPFGMTRHPGTMYDGFVGDRRVARWDNAPPGGSLQTLPEAQERAALARLQRQATGLAVGLFLTKETPLAVAYAAAGTAESADGQADVLDVSGPENLRLRLFLDRQSHRILMAVPSIPLIALPNRVGPEGERWYFSGHRRFGRLTLPTLLVVEAKERPEEEWSFETVRVGAPIPSDLAGKGPASRP